WSRKLMLPVVTQPSRSSGVSSSAITTVIQTGGDWSTSLFSICHDTKICICGTFCLLCLESKLARHHGECLCLPLLPGSALTLRTGIRERYRIR
ncbi:hypothetical protein NDU88_005331, partial [Pleurodeles waltl]